MSNVHPDVIRFGLEEILVYIVRGDVDQVRQLSFLLIETTSQEDRADAVACVLKTETADLYARIWAQVQRNMTVTES